MRSKTIDCVFIGYANNSSVYRFLVHKFEILDEHIDTIIESRNVVFFQDIFNNSHKQTYDTAIENYQEDSNHQVNKPKHGKRQKIHKTFGPYFLTYLLENDPRHLTKQYPLPKILFGKNRLIMKLNPSWITILGNLFNFLRGNKALGCKWIFKTKLKLDGSIDKYKARLVVKGYKQKGLDLFDTYSPVTRITSIRVVIAIAALHNLEIYQMDIKTPFLNGEFKEEIYTEQPESFIAPRNENKVCFVKSMYGFKQTPK